MTVKPMIPSDPHLTDKGLPPNIGKNIAISRKSHGMTQGDLAAVVGVARQTVAKWESGAAIPDLENAKAISKTLSISLDRLVGLEDENEDNVPFMPHGKKFFGVCKLGSYGTLRIPEDALELFDLHTGDELVVLGNPTYGIGVCKAESLRSALDALKERLGV